MKYYSISFDEFQACLEGKGSTTAVDVLACSTEEAEELKSNFTSSNPTLERVLELMLLGRQSEVSPRYYCLNGLALLAEHLGEPLAFPENYTPFELLEREGVVFPAHNERPLPFGLEASETGVPNVMYATPDEVQAFLQQLQRLESLPEGGEEVVAWTERVVETGKGVLYINWL